MMRIEPRAIAWLAAIVAAAGAPAVSTSADNPTVEGRGADFTFAGRVLDPEGRPLAGARVYFSGLTPSIEFRERTISGAEGKFRFTVKRAEIKEAEFPASRLPIGQHFAVGAMADGCGTA